MGRGVKAEVSIETNFTAFLVLWKVHKYREALTYIKLCTQSINDLNRHHSGSFSPKTRLNLVGIIAMSLSACILKTDGDPSHSIEILDQCLQQLSDLDVEAKPLMYRLMERLGSYKDPLNESVTSSAFEPISDGLTTPDYSLPSLPSEYFERKAANAAGHPYIKDHFDDVLATKDFESVFFITAFLSHIDPSTPLIRESELELAEARQHSTFLPKNLMKSKGSRVFFPQYKELPVVQRPGYLKLFRNIVNKGKGGVQGMAGIEKGRGTSFRHRIRSESVMDREGRTKSVPLRGRPVIFQSYGTPTYRSHRISPSITVLKDLKRRNLSMLRKQHNVESMQIEALSRRKTKQNIMVEFAPESRGLSDIGISLHPLAFASLASPESALSRFLRLPVGKLTQEETSIDSL